MDESKEPANQEKQVEVVCPKCQHRFWHKVKEKLAEVADGIGTAIGDAKFGG